MRRLLLCVSLLAALTALAATAQARVNGQNEAKNARPASLSVFATGLNNPRGLHSAPMATSTSPKAARVATESTGAVPAGCPPVGAVHRQPNDRGGRISKVTPAGVRTTLASGSRRARPIAASAVW